MMTLHENPELFRDAVTATAQRLSIPEIYIEKDYWVTVALKTIFESASTNEAVFKGGTALSKCYKIIERFSEDIDLVVIKHADENDNDLKRKIKAISQIVDSIIPEIQVEGVTTKFGMNRKTAHAYTKADFKGNYGQVREHIVVEATWLGNAEPFTTANINCFIMDMMVDTGQSALIEKWSLQPFSVRVLTKERTICEKIMSLVRFSNTDQPYTDLANKVRHIYDIHMMLKDPEVADFFDDDEFDKMLTLVGSDDVLSFKNNNEWLKIHPKEAIIFADPGGTWEAIKAPYRTSFQELVTGELPDEKELITTLEKVAQRIGSVAWNIKTK